MPRPTTSANRGLKSFKAKGKRLVTYALDTVTEIEPLIADGDDDENPETSDIIADGDESDQSDATPVGNDDISDDELRDEITGQKRIF